MTSTEIEYYFLPCKVSKGLFSTERQVSVRLQDGREFVAFVDERNVQIKSDQHLKSEEAVDGWIKVFPVKVTETKALVDLPTQGSFVEGPRIEISPKELIQPT
jgi:hypothetical protein